MSLQLRRLSYGLGAEIRGLDLTQPLDGPTVRAVRQAWLDHLVLVLPDQRIKPEQHIRFSAHFGPVEDYPLAHYQHPAHPKIFLLTNEQSNGKQSETRDAGRHWHSDLSFTTTPALGSILHCQKIPDIGGDTMFTNMYMAYERLSPLYQRIIEPLWAVHALFSKTKGLDKLDPQQIRDMRQRNPRVAQPMVRVHPEAGRPALYVSEALTSEIVGLTEEESAGILAYLFRHSVRAEFTYRHRWRPFDILMWDNRCTMHMAVPDNDHSMPRLMHRTTITGTPCGELVPDDLTGWQPATRPLAAA